MRPYNPVYITLKGEMFPMVFILLQKNELLIHPEVLGIPPPPPFLFYARLFL